ncbi:MAG: SOS response-associated peptidase family protein [Methylococcales bacterium]
MCGRYNIIPGLEAWSAAFNLSNRATEFATSLEANYNILPSNQVPIVRGNSTNSRHDITLVHRGLIPFRAKSKIVGIKMINKRKISNRYYNPCCSDWIKLIPVSTYVNSPRNNDVTCIAPQAG